MIKHNWFMLFCIGAMLLLADQGVSGLSCYTCLFGCNGKFDHESVHVHMEDNCQSCTKITYNGDIYRFCSQDTGRAGCTNGTQGPTCSCYTNLCNGATGNQSSLLVTTLLIGTLVTFETLRRGNFNS